jgi:hypothetical protein
MASSAISVPVQWAWRGRDVSDSGYRLLSYSTRGFGARNFEDILDRFSPGTLEKLPQVAVSYVRTSDDDRHLGMAIYEQKTGGFDRFGRDVIFVRYFCVPYQDLADGAVPYLAMYEALKDIQLPDVNGPPIDAHITAGVPMIPDDAARVLQVTELLLTGNPVCIVGADSTSAEERLAFIDSVMSLLPYGMRAEMTAATWTSSIFRQHKFRLFFSEAPRRQPESGPGDHLVSWRPDRLEVRPALAPRLNPEWAEEYQDWLRPLLEKSVTEKLAGQSEPRSFKASDILKLVETAPRTRRREPFRIWNQAPRPDARGNPRSASPAEEKPSRGNQDGDGPVANPQQAGRPGTHAKPDPEPADRVALLIGRLERDLRAGNALFVETAVDQISAELVERPPSDVHRRQREAIIKRDRLLREDLPLGKGKKGPFYRLLLRAVFGADIKYADYLRIGDMVSPEAAHKQLLQVIEEATTDLRVNFLVRHHLSGGHYPRSGLNPLSLIDMAADPELREDHAQIIWDATMVTLDALSSNDRGVVRAILRERGFLAQRLRARAPHDQDFQAVALVDLLESLYGRPIGSYALEEIFTGYRNSPTEALLVAVLQLVDPDSLPYVLYYFLDSYARSEGLDSELRDGFARLGYGIDPGATPGAPADDHGTRKAQQDPAASDVPQSMPTRIPDPPSPRRKILDRVIARRGEFSMIEAKEAAKKLRDDDER